MPGKHLWFCASCGVMLWENWPDCPVCGAGEDDRFGLRFEGVEVTEVEE